MNWKPKSENEVMESQLCAEGKAPFTILEAAVVESKSDKNFGKEMLKLKLNVHADDGFDYHIYDYVAPWFMEHKFRHFWFCVGRGSQYESGTADIPGLVGLEGWCDVGRSKPKGEYGPKNTIRDYVVENAAAKAQEAAAPVAKPASKLVGKAKPAPVEDDDVPFK